MSFANAPLGVRIDALNDLARAVHDEIRDAILAGCDGLDASENEDLFKEAVRAALMRKGWSYETALAEVLRPVLLPMVEESLDHNALGPER